MELRNMELRKGVTTMSRIKWDDTSDVMEDVGQFGDVFVQLCRDRLMGTWSFYVDGRRVDHGYESREIAREELEKHLGIFVPADAASIETAFKAELAALLAKYDATLEAEDHYPGYPEDDEDIRMTVSVPSRYTPDGDRTRESVEIDLGESFDGKAKE
jgi:hypothetical protein